MGKGAFLGVLVTTFALLTHVDLFSGRYNVIAICACGIFLFFSVLRLTFDLKCFFESPYPLITKVLDVLLSTFFGDYFEKNRCWFNWKLNLYGNQFLAKESLFDESEYFALVVDPPRNDIEKASPNTREEASANDRELEEASPNDGKEASLSRNDRQEALPNDAEEAYANNSYTQVIDERNFDPKVRHIMRGMNISYESALITATGRYFDPDDGGGTSRGMHMSYPLDPSPFGRYSPPNGRYKSLTSRPCYSDGWTSLTGGPTYGDMWHSAYVDIPLTAQVDALFRGDISDMDAFRADDTQRTICIRFFTVGNCDFKLRVLIEPPTQYKCILEVYRECQVTKFAEHVEYFTGLSKVELLLAYFEACQQSPKSGVIDIRKGGVRQGVKTLHCFRIQDAMKFIKSNRCKIITCKHIDQGFWIM